eukprot:SAG11_NODE_1575_length_4659_cov_2.048904_1_plen_59_part_00
MEDCQSQIVSPSFVLSLVLIEAQTECVRTHARDGIPGATAIRHRGKHAEADWRAACGD